MRQADKKTSQTILAALILVVYSVLFFLVFPNFLIFPPILFNQDLNFDQDNMPPNIHGWSKRGDWDRVRHLQEQTAHELGKPVIFQDHLSKDTQGPKMVIIPAGCYQMGSSSSEPGRESDEGLTHQVCLSSFALGQYEVTKAQFRAFIQASGYRTDAEKNADGKKGCYIWIGSGWQWKEGASWKNPGYEQSDQDPVTCISWRDAQAYVNWLSQQTGQNYRLPTEFEWEYAARGGTSTPFYTGNCIHTKQANYYGKSDYNHCGAKTGVYLGRTQPVGSYPPNPFHLYDMAGNIQEWVQDCYSRYGGFLFWKTAFWTSGGICAWHVARSGSWDNIPKFLRSANRFSYLTEFRNNLIGLRVARDILP